MSDLARLAVIPARGGSRGISRKNLELVGGLPLVARTVRTALASGVFAAIVVSTDDEEIARIAADHGAEVVMRPGGLAQDASPTEPVMAHALAEAERSLGLSFDSVWLLQPTSPFLLPEDISRAGALLEGGGCDSVVAVYADHPFSWSELPSGGLVEPSYDVASRPRRQDMPAYYRENGALYAASRSLWNKCHVRVGGRVAPLPMPGWRSLDIDDAADLEAARALVSRLGAVSPRRGVEPASVRAVALDFDGVMTDDKVVLDEHGKEAVVCSRRDGLGIARLHEVGMHVAVFSTEKNPVVSRRCSKLAVDCYQGLADKEAAVLAWLHALDLTPRQLAFLGNDVNDLACLRLAGLSVAPADAHTDVLGSVDLVLTRRGGDGVVRELADLILESR